VEAGVTGEQMVAAVVQLAKEGVYVETHLDADLVLVDVLGTEYSTQDTKDLMREIFPDSSWQLGAFPEVVS
jgi:hypothetical protein